MLSLLLSLLLLLLLSVLRLLVLPLTRFSQVASKAAMEAMRLDNVGAIKDKMELLNALVDIQAHKGSPCCALLK